MFKRIIVIFLFVFTSNCSPGYKGNETQEHLGKTIFNAFLNDEYDTFVKYVVTAEDYIKLLDSANYSPKKKEKLIQKYNSDTPIMNKQISGNFNDVKKDMAKNGMSFKDVNFEKTEFRDMKYAGTVYSYINIVFNHNGKKYFIRLMDCLKTGRGWVIGGVVYLSEYPVE